MAITYGDIRARFTAAMQIYEATKEYQRDFFEKAYAEYVKKIQYSGSLIKAKTGESLRADFGEDGPQMLTNMLLSAGLDPTAFVVNAIAPRESGSKSGQFETLELQIHKDQNTGSNPFRKGDIHYIVNRVSINKDGGKAAVGKKDLSPDKLGLTKNTYPSNSHLVSSAKQAVNSTNIPDNYKQFLSEVMDQIAASPTAYENMEELIQYGQTDFEVKLTENLIQKYSIDPISLNNIANDFGEILGGVWLFSEVKNTGSGVSYPTQSNAALVDFIFDGWKISSKAGKRGGLPSIASLVHAVLGNYRQGIITPSTTELDLIQNVFEVIEKPTSYFKENGAKRSSDVYSTFVAIANKYLLNSNTGYKYIVSALNLDANTSFTRNGINEALDNAFKDGTLWDVISPYFKLTNTVPRGFENKNNTMKRYEAILNDENRFGIVFYPLTKEVVEELNNRFRDDLSTLVNQASTVQQLYLFTNPKSNSVKFKIKSFDTANFKFVAGASAPTPLNKNIAIESL